MSSLIQNYIASRPTVTQPAVVSNDVKPKPDFDINRELHNRNFLKPLKGKGKLVSGNILLAPKQKIDNISYNLKSLYHAFKGKANDHELGKINDIGLVTGGLGIASYLVTKRTTPMTKGMEFVGLGGFLASMTLWPQIAIQLPAYLIHGVNVHKKYVDSFGRTKPFYQDPQFIPWDLYSDKQIDKIGDRMGVPKNIQNRRDFIQEKMRKLAVQNNTLWMLTAGFATPVMTALMCNVSEPYITKYMNNRRSAKADAILKNLGDASKKYQTHDIENGLKSLAKQHLDKPIDAKTFDEISELFTRKMDFITSVGFKKDLSEYISSGKFLISEDSAKNISKKLPELFDKKHYSKEFLDMVLPNEAVMTELFNSKGFIGKALKPVEFQNIKLAISDLVSKNVEKYNSIHSDKPEDAKFIRTLINGKATEKNAIISELMRVPSISFDTTCRAKLNNVAKIFDDFQAKNSALDEYALLKVGSAPETVIANYWNDTSKEFLNILGVSQSELEKVRFDKNLMGNLLRERIETIVSDKKTYENTLRKLVQKIASLDDLVKSSDMTSHLLRGENPQINQTAYEKEVDTLFNTYAKSFKDNGFGRTADSISGDWCSYKNIQKAFVEERILGVKSSFYRLINMMDFYRRAVTVPNEMKGYNLIPRETKEELIELCKDISLRGHSSDYATKFYMLRNPHPADDYSNIDVENGKIKYKYFGQVKKEAVDISGDKFFYQNAMKFMHGDEMHSETQNILNEAVSIKDEVNNYRRLVFDKIGGEYYFFKPRHRVSSDRSAGSDIKFLLTGIAPEEMFFKTGQQMFNTKKWLSIFGKFGGVLLGVTVLAQFFLGKLKVPKGDSNA